ncbi:putative F-box protein isoform X1 [Capsicum galapagoense]
MIPFLPFSQISCRKHSWYKFSLLEAQDVFKSSVLSKRWHYLWKSIYNFHFNDRNYNHVENFVSFVDHVLTHSTCSNINKFQLDIHNREWDIHSKISQWFIFAVNKKVEHVVLHAYPSIEEPTYELPLSMYSCSSLITLYLSYVVFDKGLCIAWNSLKSLTLDSTELEDDDIVRLLSSCPALETMEFSCCVGCHRLEMASSNLKTLKLHSHCHLPFVGYGTLEMFAPHLQHLDISGELHRSSVAGTNMILRKIVVMIIIKFQKPCAGLSSKVELCDRANNWKLACRV